MNVKDCLDLLMARCARRSNPTLRADALKEMALVQVRLEHAETLPWFLVSEEAEAEITADMIGDPRLPLPTDFLREVEDDNLTLFDEDGIKISDVAKVGYDEGRLQYPDDIDPSTPKLYSIRGNYIILRPAPDKVMTLRFPSYYARQDPPVDDSGSENGWFENAPDLMIAKTGVIIAGHYIKDAELAALYGAEQQVAMEKLAHEDTAREEANRSRRMG